MRIDLRKIKWNRILVIGFIIACLVISYHAWVQFQIDLTCMCE